MDVERMKSKLQTIVELARLRRERIDETAVAPLTPSAPAGLLPEDGPAPDTRVESQQPKSQPQVTPDVQPEAPPVVELEPTPETHPELFIEVHTPELIRLGGSEFSNDFGREVLSGKMIVTYRRRLPTDGDATFVLVPPKPRAPRGSDEKIEWPSWGRSGLVDPRIRSRTSRNWSWGGDNRNAAYYDARDAQGQA